MFRAELSLGNVTLFFVLISRALSKSTICDRPQQNTSCLNGVRDSVFDVRMQSQWENKYLSLVCGSGSIVTGWHVATIHQPWLCSPCPQQFTVWTFHNKSIFRTIWLDLGFFSSTVNPTKKPTISKIRRLFGQKINNREVLIGTSQELIRLVRSNSCALDNDKSRPELVHYDLTEHSLFQQRSLANKHISPVCACVTNRICSMGANIEFNWHQLACQPLTTSCCAHPHLDRILDSPRSLTFQKIRAYFRIIAGQPIGHVDIFPHEAWYVTS